MCYWEILLANCEAMCEISREKKLCQSHQSCQNNSEDRDPTDGGLIPQETLNAGPCPNGHEEMHAATG
ncbi:hypothetical protein MN608_01582 [Microdochium nivale]|nr:hypothetical protein MN608_01582 [Microdochium nivale]